ncbi:MAG: hypothetical protein GY866_27605 [Proteobacteria bacterium]|nr:hypothetical protein [Pseudomonadota bacterium]
MHDIMDLEKRGLPGGFVASREFEEAALAQARSVGFYPEVAYVPHPIQDKTDDEMRRIADEATESILRLIWEE